MSDAIPAATLVSWRDLATGPEILVVERASTMAFAAGAVVFPGGRVDAEDRLLAEALGQPDTSAKITAIRETLEESAVPTGVAGVKDADHAHALQQELIEGRPFADLLGGHGLTLDLNALTPFARWMPAFKQPRKFDTLFFVAAAPEGDFRPTPQPGECVSAEWQAPAALIRQIAAGERRAIFPTKRNLERLAQHDRLAAMVEDAIAHSLDTIIPWIEDIGGEQHVRIPDNRGYPVLSEPLNTAFRA